MLESTVSRPTVHFRGFQIGRVLLFFRSEEKESKKMLHLPFHARLTLPRPR